MYSHFLRDVWLILLCASVFLSFAIPVFPESATDFVGTVLSVDAAAGKFAVKKDGSGTRFTFVANEKTKFGGEGLKGLADLKKGDHVIVTYAVTGSQYLAQTVTRK
ncbi:MAG TPA: hypothetical protein VGQ60_00035 [Nitrospiraceae bacterium]|jgi:hypothetical protein|nr:hypothetical protein [Nitrospiraceae bacterium]